MQGLQPLCREPEGSRPPALRAPAATRAVGRAGSAGGGGSGAAGKQGVERGPHALGPTGKSSVARAAARPGPVNATHYSEHRIPTRSVGPGPAAVRCQTNSFQSLFGEL